MRTQGISREAALGMYRLIKEADCQQQARDRQREAKLNIRNKKCAKDVPADLVVIASELQLPDKELRCEMKKDKLKMRKAEQALEFLKAWENGELDK